VYSPLAQRALPATTSNNKSNKESRRIPPISRSTIYAQREAAQAAAASLCEANPDASKHVRCAPPTGRRLQQFDFITKQVLPSLASPNQRDLVAVNQCFRGQRTRIVIGRHHKSVSTRAHNRQQIIFMQFWHLAIEREKIARFAHRPHDVDLLRRTITLARNFTLTWRFTSSSPCQGEGLGEGAWFLDRYDLVIAMVKRRPNQIVHARIDNREFLLGSLFDVADSSEQHACVADKKTTRLNQDSNPKLAQRWHNRVSVVADAKRGSRACGTVVVPPFA